jgi:hypothetical protein
MPRVAACQPVGGCINGKQRLEHAFHYRQLIMTLSTTLLDTRKARGAATAFRAHVAW